MKCQKCNGWTMFRIRNSLWDLPLPMYAGTAVILNFTGKRSCKIQYMQYLRFIVLPSGCKGMYMLYCPYQLQEAVRWIR